MDKAKKKQIKKVVTWVALAALVAGLTAMPLLAKAECFIACHFLLAFDSGLKT